MFKKPFKKCTPPPKNFKLSTINQTLLNAESFFNVRIISCGRFLFFSQRRSKTKKLFPSFFQFRSRKDLNSLVYNA